MLSGFQALKMLAGLVGFVLRRMVRRPGLTLLSLAGVVLAVALMTNAGFFARAVDRGLLVQELADFGIGRGRPPLAVRFYTYSSPGVPVDLKTAQDATSHVVGAVTGEVGLPAKGLSFQAFSGRIDLGLPDGSRRTSLMSNDYVNVAYLADAAQRIEIVEGAPFADGEAASASGVAEVWMHEEVAEATGSNIGDTLVCYPDDAVDEVGRESPPFEVHVAGIWRSLDNEALAEAGLIPWFEDPEAALGRSLLVSRADFLAYVEPVWPLTHLHRVNWDLVLDETLIVPTDAERYITGFRRALSLVKANLPNALYNDPPLDPLRDYVRRDQVLTLLLLTLNIPAFGFLVYFVVLSSQIIAEGQQRDTAILVSRGTSIPSAVGLAAIEETLLFLVGYPLGIAAGMGLARVLGFTSSFCTFGNQVPLSVRLDELNVPLSLAALALHLVPRLVAVARRAGTSVVEIEREQARPVRPPFWHRWGVDLMLVLPTYYAYRQLVSRGALAALVRERPEEIMQDPLLVLVPALFVLCFSLLALRLFPLLMRVLDGLAAGAGWVPGYLALRQLGRQYARYMTPVLLVAVALGLGIYSFSMALSLDQWLVDRTYYRTGADLAFTPYREQPSTGYGQAAAPEIGGAWIPPDDAFLGLPGVTASTSVGDYEMRIGLGQSASRGRFLALDRVRFPEVAWWRSDLAPDSLGALMNRLAQWPEAILVPESLMEERGLGVGDVVVIAISLESELRIQSDFTVAGSYREFPTVYPEEGITVIGNLSYLTSIGGLPPAHEVWLRTAETPSGLTILRSVSGTGVEAGNRRDARASIAKVQSNLEQVGVMGTLTLGFLAALTIAAVGLLQQSYASLHERLLRFSVLRALGLGRDQLIAQVTLEHTGMALVGALVGAAAGLAAAQVFVPFMRVTEGVGTTAGLPMPELVPVIAGAQAAWLVPAFVAVLGVVELFIVMRNAGRITKIYRM